ncbi:uncharacterized protein LOC113272366 [Papaver somniferum]|uniref:uncharacterized protein LOC113272366 n=1 Tax=Papaver somniferum TaxID=3469 RepID=UPI000E6F7DA0|nr:uncharacterized protein LOC113272366 [Papaver somniferum]
MGYGNNMEEKLLQKNYMFNVPSEFAMKVLCDLHYFLGVKEARESDSLVLTQKKICSKLLDNDNILECKPCDTSIVKTDQEILFMMGIISSCITLSDVDINSIEAHLDSDWAGCHDTRRSTSCEAEYKCLSSAASELR